MLTDKVVLLTCEGDVGVFAARYLSGHLPGLAVIVERPASRAQLLRRRIKRLGLAHVAGQLAFMAFQRIQQKVSKERIAEIIRAAGLDAQRAQEKANERSGFRRSIRPNASAISGDCGRRRSWLSAPASSPRDVLRAVDTPFINYHAGITPKYRGVHGGYWAKSEGDLGNFGVTVHLVDAGIDTGGVLYQARLAPTAEDNYSTYPYLQLVAALPLLQRAARDAVAGTLRPEKVDLPSHLWSHPTLWHYIKTGLRRGAW